MSGLELLSWITIVVSLTILFVSFMVWIVRSVVRLITLFAAVWFFQADGTNGDVLRLAQNMMSFVFRGVKNSRKFK